MKATELRIGNLVKSGDVEGTIDFHIQFDFDEGGWYVDDMNIDNVRPIPLTEEWLVKFGFGKKMASVTHTYSFIKGSMIIGNPLRASMHYNDIELKHVHTLQNLYFALTGEELELNKKEK